ncbi:MAG TPA: cupin domain-containing protein [Solirubrobacter sp.]|nr:cupin domain-containing protein [Solirubrobacter sp.]
MTQPPPTDEGTVPNLRFSFAEAHNRLEPGGWAREVTERELPVATALAGVNMHLDEGAVRELHWHKQAEWAYMLCGRARITAFDVDGRAFADDVGEGGLWYFPAGIPHSIQGLRGGCEFLLVFDDGGFSENATFLISDWLAHTPRDVVARNLGVDEAALDALPEDERYIFPSHVPGPLADAGGPRFSHRLLEHEPVETPGGRVWIADSDTFPVAKTIAAALVEVDPGALRELHWHPNADEWQYYLAGEARMSVFASSGTARTFDYRAGDVGYVPFAIGHYVENTGDAPLRFLELFRSDRFADVSLNDWLAATPPALVRAHLHVGEDVIEAVRARHGPVVR